MNVISSQRYLDLNKVDEKIAEIENSDKVTLPVVYAGNLDGNDLYILVDGHHTAEAAKELGITIEYKIRDRNEAGYNEEWTLDEILENCWIDSDWYYFETGELVF